MHKVFVYGTLKKHEPNHHWLTTESNGYAKFLGKAHTIEKYPLVIGTKYNIPFLLFSPGNGNIVEGEIYEINEKMLANLDILEDHPNYYKREEHTLVLEECETGNIVNTTCWIYFIKNFGQHLFDKPKYVNYSSKGDHNLPYCERYEESTVSDLNDP